ncbi:hypothetical protein CPB84DRAFT_912119 [Gymnopilus junonius]|uniref:Uncharacterized protein n=1 Tax=Gymnopilus junonius TaxID=109634 RepID=A0A9P5NPB4_GYMJU|nr:hypothetical protein CPB84DRAFT_912119 [Gymnopilus junonius]
MAGLTPEIATVAEMDQKDVRLLCRKEDSDWNQYSPEVGYYVVQVAYAWREAIEHELACRHECQWEMLSQEDADRVRMRERESNRWKTSNWTCDHCTIFMDDLQTRQEVVDHIKTESGFLVHDSKFCYSNPSFFKARHTRPAGA